MIQKINKLRLPVLLIPVFRGGDDFKRCLKSLKNCAHLFSKIFISINGSQSSEDESSIMQSDVYQHSPSILKTDENLSAVQHIIWITCQLKSQISGDDKIFLLCHDDELNQQHYEKWLPIHLASNINTAWIGNYKVVNMSLNGSIISSLPSTAISQPLSCKEWLIYNSQQSNGHVFTNASGICVPFYALEDVANFWTFTRARIGGRFEYMMLSHKLINGISCCPNPIVTIHESLGQSGRNRSNENISRDEIRYSIWLMLNAKNAADLFYVMRSQWGVSGITRGIIQIIKLIIKGIIVPLGFK